MNDDIDEDMLRDEEERENDRIEEEFYPAEGR